MEAIILAGGKAERLGDAAGGRPKALVESPASRSRRTRSPGSRAPASTRVIVVVRRGPGRALRAASSQALGAEIVAAEEPERLGRGGGIKFAARRATSERRRLRAERRRARRRRLRGAARAAPRGRRRSRRSPSRSRSRRSASSTSTTTTSCAASARAAASPTGSTAASTSSRPRRSSGSPTGATTSRRRSRSSPPRGAARLPPRGPLADREHAEGAARRAEHVDAHPEWLA